MTEERRVVPLRPNGDDSGVPPPPVNVDAEQALLGAILINNAAYGRVAEFLRADHFSNPVHTRIFAAIGALIERGQNANPITLKNLFDQDGALAEAGGAQYLARLATAAVTIINAEDYGRVIHDLALRRQLIAVACDIDRDARLPSFDDEAGAQMARAVATIERIAHDAGARHGLLCEPIRPRDIADIPPRPWAYGNFLMFGQVAVLGAIDGGGKGAMAVVIALSMITGQPLLAETVWRPGAVAVLSYEDDETEWSRRIAAASIHYGLPFRSVASGFHFLRRGSQTPTIATLQHDRLICPDSEAIIRHLRRIDARLLIVDPFNLSHELDDGNNNVRVGQVAKEIARIARESGVAGLVLHHLRKGNSGHIDDLMGAASLRATVRSTRILSRMSDDEAERLNIRPQEAWRHSRIAASKENYAPPPDLATWYKLESVRLDNPSADYPEGDSVQVTTPWSPPSAFDGLSLAAIARIFEAIRAGPGEGEFYSPDRRSKRWVGAVIAANSGKGEADAARILRSWLKNQVLFQDSYVSPERREPVGRVDLNESKAAEILGTRYRPDSAE
jgi:hypothetical protein